MQTSRGSGTHVAHALVFIILTILCYFQSSVDRMLQRGNASMMVGVGSWKDQFVDAFTVQAGECHSLAIWISSDDMHYCLLLSSLEYVCRIKMHHLF